MKKHILFSVSFIILSFHLVYGQVTVVLQPAANQGKDAVVWSNQANSNYPDLESNTAYTWTNGGILGIKRSYIQFDFSNIPANAIVTSAYLSLYYNPTDPYEGFDVHTGSNEIYIQRVSAPWDENTITWNNQPPASQDNELSLPPSINDTQDYLDIDVTELVVDMTDPSLGNHGFLIRMVDEVNFYKSVLFASSNHPVDSLHPKLEITYELVADTCTFLKPGAAEGKDAVVWSNQANSNYPDLESNTAYTWTNSGILGIKRSYIAFDLSDIPANAIVTSASLSLFFNPTDPYEGFDVHTGSNELFIERVSAPWDESTITWNNQPPTSQDNQVSLPPSMNDTQDYLDIDVTNLVKDMTDPSLGNHGFLIRMVDEVNFYKSVIFASSDHPDDSLHPELEVCWIIDTTLTGIADPQFGRDIQIFPNPNTGIFNIELSSEVLRDYEVEVYDLTGRKILFDEPLNGEIHVREKGIFLVKITDDRGRFASKKVIVR